MIINADYVQLSRLLGQLQNCIGEYNRSFNIVNSHLNEYGGWIGKDKDKYVEQAGVLQQNINKMVKNIDMLAHDVGAAAAKYKETADTIAPHAGRI